MDKIIELIGQYKSENIHSLENINDSRRPNIIVELEDFIDDARVVNFYLEVAQDEMEYDLARIEVFKIFEIWECTNYEFRKKIANAIREVLVNSHCDDVRNYAAMAASSYMDLEHVSEVVFDIVQDPREDANLRWNAFAAIKSHGPSLETIELLRALLRDNDFKQSAARILSEWKAKE